MFENYKLKKDIGNLRKDLDHDQFLGILRGEVEEYSAKNPVIGEIFEVEKNRHAAIFTDPINKKFQEFPFGNLKTNPKYAKIAKYSVAFAFFGAGVALATERSLPGDTLYPVKLIAEDMQYASSFSADSKAKLHATFAARRVSEIKAVLAKKSVEPEGLDQALSRLEYNASGAAEALKEQKDAGLASELAKNINESFNEQKKELTQTFNDKDENLRSREKDIKTKIREAKKTGNVNVIESLSKELDGIKNDRKSMLLRKNETFQMIGDKKEELINLMDEDERANENKKEIIGEILELERVKNDLEANAKEAGLNLSWNNFNLFDEFIQKAQDALAQENYADVEMYLENAKIEIQKESGSFEVLVENLENEDSGSVKSESREGQKKTPEDSGIGSGTFEKNENKGKE